MTGTVSPNLHVPGVPVQQAPASWQATCSCGEVSTGTRATQAQGRSASHAAAANLALCPHPDKVRYASRFAAEVQIGRAMRYAALYGDGYQLRAYQCCCGRWHLTSKPFKPWRPDA